MPSMDVFNSEPFSMTSLTSLVSVMDYVPQFLGSLDLFTPQPINTQDLFVERENDALALIPQTARGAPPTSMQVSRGDVIPMRTPRLAKNFTIHSHQVAGIRARGRESEMRTVQTEYAREMARLRRHMEATHELHRLGAVQGVLVDAGGDTIFDYYTQFGVSQAAQIDFALTTPTTNIVAKCEQVIEQMQVAAKSAFTPATRVHALCGSTFFNNLRDHEKVRDTHLGYVQGAAVLQEARPFGTFEFGSILFHRYRGTDDGTSIAVATNEAKFFPQNAEDFFEVAYSPPEFGEEFVNTLGQEVYANNVIDPLRRAWTMGELYSYPLYICKRPNALQRAVGNS